jgi:hypothetical protein
MSCGREIASTLITCLLDCLVEVADAVDDVEEAPAVLLGPRLGVVRAGEGGCLRRVHRGPDLRRRAGRAPGQPQWQLLRVQRRSCLPKKQPHTPEVRRHEIAAAAVVRGTV